jgi:hypothetical protein
MGLSRIKLGYWLNGVILGVKSNLVDHFKS